MKLAFTFALCSTFLVFLGCSKTEQASPTPEPSPAKTPPPPAPPPRAAIDESKPVELKQTWKAGKRYNHQVSMTQLSYSFTPSTPHAIEQRIKTRQGYAVDVIQPSPSAELDTTIKDFAITMAQSGTDIINFDSTRESDTNASDYAIHPSLGNFVGKQMKFFTSSSNTVDRVEGLDEIRAAVLKDALPQAQVILAGMLTTDSLKNMVEVSRGLPHKAASTGDSWPIDAEFSLGPMGTAVVSGTNSFSGWDDKAGKRCALVNYSAQIIRKPDAQASNNPNEPVKTMHNGSLSGKGWFDPIEGTLVESVTEQSMTMVFEFPRPPGLEVDRNVTNIVATTITLQLLGIEDAPKSAPNP